MKFPLVKILWLVSKIVIITLAGNSYTATSADKIFLNIFKNIKEAKTSNKE